MGISRRDVLSGLGVSLVIGPQAVWADEERDLASVVRRGLEQGLISRSNVSGLQVGGSEELILAEIVSAAVDRNEPTTAALSVDAGALLSAYSMQNKLVNKKRRPPSFEDKQQSYLDDFNKCEPKNRADLQKWVRFFSAARNKAQYERLEQATGVPWYFIATLHLREASANFLGHLHNGDPLPKKTVQVPKNRPNPWPPAGNWNAREAWVASGLDALTVEGFVGLPQDSWTIERILYRFERYNGFGFHYHKKRSLYLWSLSNIATPGGYSSDGKWKPDYVSRQIGAGLLIKQMLNDGVIDVRYEK